MIYNSDSSVEINSGASLLSYLQGKGLYIDHVSGIQGSQNCIFLPDKTSFNWKSRPKAVRVNCKLEAKNVIKFRTGLDSFSNSAGDPTRPYSLMLDNQKDLDAVIEALKTIEGNKA